MGAMRRTEGGAEGFLAGRACGGACREDTASTPVQRSEVIGCGLIVGGLDGVIELIEFLDGVVTHIVAAAVLESVLDIDSDSRDEPLLEREAVAVGIFTGTTWIWIPARNSFRLIGEVCGVLPVEKAAIDNWQRIDGQVCTVKVIAGTRTAGGILGEGEKVNIEIESTVEKIVVEMIAVGNCGPQIAPVSAVDDPAAVVGGDRRSTQAQAPAGEKLEVLTDRGQIRDLQIHLADTEIPGGDPRIGVLSRQRASIGDADREVEVVGESGRHGDARSHHGDGIACGSDGTIPRARVLPAQS